MTQKNQRGNGGNGFKHGPLYYGEGASFISDELVFRRFTSDLPVGPFLLLLILNREIYLKGNLTIEASASSLAKKTHPGQAPFWNEKKRLWEVPGERTVERWLRTLRKHRWVGLKQKGHNRIGNSLFVEPILIWSSKWASLKGIEFSQVPGLIERYRQNGGTFEPDEVGTAKMAVQYRQNGGTGGASVGTRYRQNGGHSRYSDSSESGAERHSPKNSAEGGGNVPASNEGPGQRSPNGHDQNPRPGTKGVGPEADPLQAQIQRCNMAFERNGLGKQPSLE